MATEARATPPAVAAAESVIEVELLMAWIVAPAGMPVPVTSCADDQARRWCRCP